jgi:hypothetical protein
MVWVMVEGSLNWMGGAFWIQACAVLGVTNRVNLGGRRVAVRSNRKHSLLRQG